MFQFTYYIYRNSIPSGIKKGDKKHFYMPITMEKSTSARFR